MNVCSAPWVVIAEKLIRETAVSYLGRISAIDWEKAATSAPASVFHTSEIGMLPLRKSLLDHKISIRSGFIQSVSGSKGSGAKLNLSISVCQTNYVILVFARDPLLFGTGFSRLGMRIYFGDLNADGSAIRKMNYDVHAAL
jgi:hypothetical protein